MGVDIHALPLEQSNTIFTFFNRHLTLCLPAIANVVRVTRDADGPRYFDVETGGEITDEDSEDDATTAATA